MFRGARDSPRDRKLSNYYQYTLSPNRAISLAVDRKGVTKPAKNGTTKGIAAEQSDTPSHPSLSRCCPYHPLSLSFSTVVHCGMATNPFRQKNTIHFSLGIMRGATGQIIELTVIDALWSSRGRMIAYLSKVLPITKCTSLTDSLSCHNVCKSSL